MKQVHQDIANGRTVAKEIPCPSCRPGHLLIQNSRSLISAGTERMLIDFGRANYLQKAKQQPEKVREVLQKVKTDGLMSTLEAVKSKLDQPQTMGYSSVGRVVELGEGVSGFQVGDRVVSNGCHAEIVCVPRNLSARIPDEVSDDMASFTVLGAIALQGTRLVQPTLGEAIVVIGLGLIGLLTVQILVAQGCRVLGVDFQADKLRLAEEFGAETVNLAFGDDLLKSAASFSRGRGVDAVVIAASTKSSQPVSQAAQICRKRGRIVLVGVAGLELARSDFYEKELSFQVSCSYGPGRYDPTYEKQGQDYPIGFVRWTEQRNFEAVLDMMAAGRLSISQLISGRFQIDDASLAYDRLLNDGSSLGLILEYPSAPAESDRMLRRTVALSPAAKIEGDGPTIGAIGAGNYASRVLLPAFRAAGVRLKMLATTSGVSGSHHGEKLGFEFSTTDVNSLFSDTEIDTIIVGTQHDTHARFVSSALAAGKNVYVEKPLALTYPELEEIESAYAQAQQSDANLRLMVGFNRRFSKHISAIKQRLSSAPCSIVYSVNAGAISAESWVQDRKIGGGRIVGEACHFIDLARYLAGAPIQSVHAVGLKSQAAPDNGDTASITLSFENGSIATVHYFSNGNRSVPKERLEVYQEGRIYSLDNYRKTQAYGDVRFPRVRTIKQDKGQMACVQAFVSALRAGFESPIPYSEIMEVSRASIDADKMVAA